jgi:hypothetical protein
MNQYFLIYGDSVVGIANITGLSDSELSKRGYVRNDDVPAGLDLERYVIVEGVVTVVDVPEPEPEQVSDEN